MGGILEKVFDGMITDWRHYIRAEGQVVAIVSRPSTGSPAVHYPLEDNQGSGSTLVDSAGTGYVRQSYTPFGLPRDGTDWDGAVPGGDQAAIDAISRRGYTGHSMLGAMGLIHMNGRVQDAILGRFLSPDPHVPNSGFTQSYNRYAYVNNNPLSFIDPSGFAEESSEVAVTPVQIGGDNQVLFAAVIACLTGNYSAIGGGNSGLPPLTEEGCANLRSVAFDFDPMALQFASMHGLRSAMEIFTNGWNGLTSAADSAVEYWIEEAIPVVSPVMGTLASSMTPDRAPETAIGLLTAGEGALALRGLNALRNAARATANSAQFANLTNRQLNLMLGNQQRELIRQFVGVGPEGAAARAAKFEVPAGLTRQSLEIYGEVAKRAIAEGIDKMGVQAARLQLIERALRIVK